MKEAFRMFFSSKIEEQKKTQNTFSKVKERMDKQRKSEYISNEISASMRRGSTAHMLPNNSKQPVRSEAASSRKSSVDNMDPSILSKQLDKASTDSHLTLKIPQDSKLADSGKKRPILGRQEASEVNDMLDFARTFEFGSHGLT